MTARIIYGLAVLAAIIEGLAPGAVPMGILPLVMVVLGAAYAGMAIDAEEPAGFLTVAIAIGLAAQADILNHVHVIGAYLDAILDQAMVVYFAGAVAILGLRAWSRIKGIFQGEGE